MIKKKRKKEIISEIFSSNFKFLIKESEKYF
jgi:hypothetical protein